MCYVMRFTVCALRWRLQDRERHWDGVSTRAWIPTHLTMVFTGSYYILYACKVVVLCGYFVRFFWRKEWPGLEESTLRECDLMMISILWALYRVALWAGLRLLFG